MIPRAKGGELPDPSGRSLSPPTHARDEEAPPDHSLSPPPQSRSVLRGLLVELGLTDTARVLDEEAGRLRGGTGADGSAPPRKGTSCSEGRGTKALPDTAPAAAATTATSVPAMAATERLPARGGGGVGEDRERDGQRELLCALAQVHGVESDVLCALRDLCRRGLAEHRAEDESATEGIAPLVWQLTHALIPSKEREGDGSGNGMHAGWKCLAGVFAAYANLLWTQLRLAEVVSCADFLPHGWARHRPFILAQLARTQEALQRLLLEADQIDRLGHAVDGNSEWRSGVAVLFGRGAPLLRRNANDVAAWIMRQCGKGGRERAAARYTEPLSLPVVNNMSRPRDGSDNERNNGMEETPQSTRGPWEALLGVVRHVVLTNTDKDHLQQNTQKCNKYSSGGGSNSSSKHSDGGEDHGNAGVDLPHTPPMLRWSLALLRIELLAWVVGSAAEIVDVARGSSRTSCGDALIGVWFQSCVAQLREATVVSHSLLSSSSSSSSSEILPLDNRTNGNAKVSLVEALRSTALEILTDPSPMPEFGALRVHVQNRASDNSSCGSNVSNCGAEDRVMLLAALASGRPYHYEFSRELSYRVPLQCIVRSAFCTQRTLLELQASGIPVDAQLHTMENMVAFALARQKQQEQSTSASTDHASSAEVSHVGHCCDKETGAISNDAQDSAETLLGSETEAQRRLFERDRLGVNVSAHLADTNAYFGIAQETAESSSITYRYITALLRSIVRSTGHMTVNSPVLVPTTDEEDEEGSGTDEYNRPCDNISNEVQVVTVSSCGTLMAFLTTRGRLVVFVLRGGDTSIGHETQRDKGSFCEALILDTLLITEEREPRWFEQLAVFLAFSPDARFLLCAVQNAPPSVKEGRKSDRVFPESMGKISIYSLHKNISQFSNTPSTSSTEDEKNNNRNDSSRSGDHMDCGNTCNSNTASDSKNNSNKTMKHVNSACVNTERLYGNFKIHNAPVTVARWMDPRFWREPKNYFRHGSPDDYAPIWRRAAHWHLSQLQCLSSARDGLIIRWSPADGTIIQRIATYPVYDILVSPLMQAFYTINQFGQLSMYDAWNEQSLESATEKVISVSQRGLPSSLSAIHHPVDTREDSAGTKPAAPHADGELPQTFFVGARRICFDRRCASQGWSDAEQLGAHMSRVLRADGPPTGTETRAGGRLGRRILLQVLRHEEDYSAPHAQAVLQSSSCSVSSASASSDSSAERGCEGEDTDANENEERELHRAVRGSGRRLRYPPGSHGNGSYEATVHESSLSFLRSRNLYGGCHTNGRAGGASAKEAGGGKGTTNKDAIMYKTGSRLVFEEVSQALCHTAGIWPSVQESDYAPLPQPYNLLAMSASGNATWSGEEDGTHWLCHRCRSRGVAEAESTHFSACAYYSDRQRPVGNDGHENGEANGRTLTGKSPVSSFPARRQKQGVLCACKRYRKAPQALSPTSQNGRYISITASVGPARSLIQYDRPLEFHAGIYACVVFDVLYGTVVRVIPVCPTQPHTALTENGVIASHSHTKKAPIYAIPCSMVLVQRPTTTNDTIIASSATTPVTPYNGKVNTNNMSGISTSKNGNGFGSLQQSSSEPLPSCHQESDSILLVAVGGLHSTTYVFDALSGSRVKVMKLRKNKAAPLGSAGNGSVSRAKEPRPPSKRIRRSYMRIGEPEIPRQRRPNANAKEVDEYEASDYTDGDFETYDSESGESVSEGLALFDEEQLAEHNLSTVNVNEDGKDHPLQQDVPPSLEDRRRHSFIRQLMNRYGVSAVLQGTVDILRVAPLPFPMLRVGPAPNLLRCPSFIAQLRLSSEDAHRYCESPAQAQPQPCGQSNGDATEAVTAQGHNVPFALLATQQRQLRHILASDATGGKAGHRQRSPSGNVSTRMRCGAVNSVAMFHDSANGGVYFFSSDEFGGLFMTGGLMR